MSVVGNLRRSLKARNIKELKQAVVSNLPCFSMKMDSFIWLPPLWEAWKYLTRNLTIYFHLMNLQLVITGILHGMWQHLMIMFTFWVLRTFMYSAGNNYVCKGCLSVFRIKKEVRLFCKELIKRIPSSKIPPLSHPEIALYKK